MKIRTGRHQDRNLYIQLGDEPGDEDEYLGVIFDPARAAILAEILNGDRPPFDREEPAAPEKPKVLGHPDDAAEEWLAGEFEEDRSTVGVAYERSQMIDAFHAGSDWARGQIAKFGKDADGRWITLEPERED